jgi:hypothetical protein
MYTRQLHLHSQHWLHYMYSTLLAWTKHPILQTTFHLRCNYSLFLPFH